MKKLFTLMTLLLCAVVSSWAGDTYKITFNGKNGGNTDYFSWNTSKHNFNTKFNGCTYDGVSYTSGLKMEGATQVSWTSTAKSTVTIVQSTWSDKTIKLDGTVLAVGDASTAITGCRVYTITDVASGNHSMTRGSGESGIFAIYVEYTEAAKTQLTSPEITINAANGTVTIAAVTNATKITYTTDGTEPTAESAEYKESFIVADATTVKAIAIGDNESYINSTISEKIAYLDNTTLAAPVVTAINGTINITCATPGTTIKYGTDGTNYEDFTTPVTYFSDTKIYAKAVRSGSADSDVSSVDINGAPAAVSGSLTKVLGFVTPGDNDWEYLNADDTNYGIKGKTGTDEEGWSLWISPNGSDKYDKGISGDGSVNNTYTIDGKSYQYIKNSNGRQFNFGLPTGFKANRITIYSFNNGTPSVASFWSNIAGTAYTAETVIPLVQTAGNNPDVRVFQLDEVTENISITNNGAVQQCFIAVVDYTTSEPTIAATPKSVDVTVNKGNTSGETSFTITGSNLTDGKYDISASASVEGLSFSPTQFTVSGGIVNQLITVTYEATESNEGGVVNLTATVDGKELSVPVNYVSKAQGQLLEVTTAATTWDWTSWNESLELNNEEATVYSEIIDANDLTTPSSFSATKMAFKGQFPVRAKKSQNGTWTIKTSVAGNLAVTFSDTGSSGDNPAKRYLTINGRNTKHYTQRTGKSNDQKTVTIYVPAGEINISSTQAVCMYKIVFTPAESVPTVSVTIGEEGYRTFTSSNPLDFTTPVTGLTAYKATVADNTVSFTEVTTTVPAGEGLLLKGEAGEYTIPAAATMPAAVENAFVGVLVDTEVDAGIFVLMDGTNGIGFYKTTNAFTVGANTAYLPAMPAAEGRSFIWFESETTGIQAPVVKNLNAGEIYTIAGQRVAKPTKGLYIMNGKKVVVK